MKRYVFSTILRQDIQTVQTVSPYNWNPSEISGCGGERGLGWGWGGGGEVNESVSVCLLCGIRASIVSTDMSE